MDPQKRQLKKLKRLQKVRKEKLKEKNQKKKPKKNRNDPLEARVVENTIEVNGTGWFYLQTTIDFHIL